MTFRRQPLFLETAALAIFTLTAILPLAYMLVRLIMGLFQEPSHIASALVDARQLVLLSRSAAIALLSALVALVFGLPVAFFLASEDLPLKRLFFFLVLVPVLIPSYVMAGAWIHLLSPSGFVNTVLTNLFGSSAKLTVFSTAGCAWCLGISFFPIVALIVATGLSQLDSSLLDIALLSTNRWGMFWHSILPQVLPHLTASLCLVLIFVLAQYGVPSLLGVNTYPVEIFAQFSAFYDDTGAVATAVPLIALVIFLILFQRRLMQSHDYVRITPSSENKNPITLKKFKYYATVFLMILFIITTVLPFFSVFVYTQGFDKILATLRSFSDSIITTSSLALLAAVIATVIAFPIGQHLAHSRSRFTKMLDVIYWLPIAVPGTIIAVGLINLANRIPFLLRSDSFCFLLLCAYVGMFSAFSIRIFEAAHKHSDPNIADVAMMDCPHWYQRLLYIDLPIHSKAIALSMIVVFVLAVGELNATVLLIPPGKATLGVSIDNLLHYGASATASALCLIEATLVVCAISLGLFTWSATKKVL